MPMAKQIRPLKACQSLGSRRDDSLHTKPGIKEYTELLMMHVKTRKDSGKAEYALIQQNIPSSNEPLSCSYISPK